MYVFDKKVLINKVIKSYLTKKKFRISLLKSPHVNKKAKEHFQVIFYRFEILIHNSNICILNFLFLNKPKSISSRVSVRRVV
jgi:ribosomal protein S10